MAKYTMELRTVIDIMGRDKVESWFKDYELSDYLTNDEIEVIETRGTWNMDKLARDIVDYYFMREIGLETIALFKHYAKITMREIMEEKLPLIYSASIKYDPLINVDYIESYERNLNNESNAEDKTNSNTSGLTVVSDTPQGQINKTSILNGDYASNTSAGESESETTGTSTGESKTNEVSSKHIKGNSGVSATAQAMVKQYRDNIRGINKEIISELNTLFMGLY